MNYSVVAHCLMVLIFLSQTSTNFHKNTLFLRGQQNLKKKVSSFLLSCQQGKQKKELQIQSNDSTLHSTVTL